MPNFGVVGMMEMETEMEMEILVSEINLFIRSGFFRRSKEWMHCYYSHVISSLNEYVGSADHALKP